MYVCRMIMNDDYKPHHVLIYTTAYRFPVAFVYERWQSQVFEVWTVGDALEAALPLTTALPTMPDNAHTDREAEKGGMSRGLGLRSTHCHNKYT
jgi:hypothetical protein